MIGNGNGTFKPQVTYPVGTTPYRLTAGDLNGDGNVDLIVANYGSNTVSVLQGNGDGTFQPQVTYPTGNQPFSAAVADFNGDGVPDLAVSNRSDGTVGIFLNNFTQTAMASISNVSVAGSGTHQIDASYPGDTNFGDSTSGTIPLTALPQATTLALSASPTSSLYSQSVVLTATLNPSTLGNMTTTGETVTFMNGATTLGTGTLNSIGVAT